MGCLGNVVAAVGVSKKPNCWGCGALGHIRGNCKQSTPSRNKRRGEDQDEDRERARRSHEDRDDRRTDRGGAGEHDRDRDRRREGDRDRGERERGDRERGERRDGDGDHDGNRRRDFGRGDYGRDRDHAGDFARGYLSERAEIDECDGQTRDSKGGDNDGNPSTSENFQKLGSGSRRQLRY